MLMLRVTTGNGKYTYVQDSTGASHALRHGQPWRDCTGDSLILCLAQDVEKYKERVEQLEEALNDLVRNSTGVAGLHLNGDVAPWSDLLSGGRFEEWLGVFDEEVT